MAISLLLKTDPILAQIAELVLDASIEETHLLKSKVTKFPVENGSTTTDHIFNEPEELTIKGFVSNHPLNAASNVPSNTTPPVRRAQAAYFDLVRIRDKRQPVSIVTGLVNYSNMALESLSVPRNSQTGDGLEFTAVFVKINKVNTVTIPAKYLKEKAASSKVDGGPRTPKGVTRSFEAVNSIVKNIKNSITGKK